MMMMSDDGYVKWCVYYVPAGPKAGVWLMLALPIPRLLWKWWPIAKELVARCYGMVEIKAL